MEYRASKKQSVGSGERRIIRKGWSWVRWLSVPIVLFALPTSLHEDIWVNLLVIAFGVGLFFLFRRAKRLEHDNVNLYLIRNKKEKVIPFTNITSIKRSAAKVNGERYWIIRYEEKGKQKSLRYFRLFWNKEFQQAVRKQNPDVVIWTHPHFNH
jgi:hypothetical protein